jgi:hypothetical protein
MDAQRVLELRRMLVNPGYGAVVAQLEAKGKEV